MGHGVSWAYAKTEADFPQPPPYGVWIRNDQGYGVFTVFNEMPLLKAHITRERNWRDCEAVVYEWKADEWVEAHRVPAGGNHKDHYLWKMAHGKTVREVPQKQYDAALASILDSAQAVQE